LLQTLLGHLLAERDFDCQARALIPGDAVFVLLAPARRASLNSGMYRSGIGYRLSGAGIMGWRTNRAAAYSVVAAIAFVFGTGLEACTTINPLSQSLGQSLVQKTPQEHAQELEPMLAAAGFNSLPASSPEQKTKLKSLPPLKLGYYVDDNGNANYWMADADYCGCLFHGDEAAYQRYETIKLENQVAQRDREAVEAQQQRQQMIAPPGFGPPGMGMGGMGGSGMSFGFGGGGMGFSF
jgi:hypothetical protein